jgi:hypothetical protein
MRRLRTSLVLALTVAAALPAAAAAKKPVAQPLADLAPLGTHFKDRVIRHSAREAHQALATDWKSYLAADGTTIAAAISDQYQNAVSDSVAQSYVDFLDSLVHGPELSTLRIYIAPPAEVLQDCGGVQGTLACYDSQTKVMTVPGEQVSAGSSGVTTSYVVAHEYGHHIAAARDNSPFNAFAFGPKYWASYEMVCNRTLKGLLAPGNESQLYLSNPGEAWAETYARLKYPDVAWQFNPILKPDAAAYAAATKDVLNPWQYAVNKVFKGTFGPTGANAKSYHFDLTLDGSLRVKLRGPSRSNYNVHLASNGRNEGTTTAAGSRDSIGYQAACRETPVEHVTATVKRVKGSGPFTLRVQYAG